MAERVGFEPTIPLQVCRISSAVHTTMHLSAGMNYEVGAGTPPIIADVRQSRFYTCDISTFQSRLRVDHERELTFPSSDSNYGIFAGIKGLDHLLPTQSKPL